MMWKNAQKKLGGPFAANGNFLILTKAWQCPIVENISMEKLIKGSLKKNTGWNHVTCILYRVLSSDGSSL